MTDHGRTAARSADAEHRPGFMQRHARKLAVLASAALVGIGAAVSVAGVSGSASAASSWPTSTGSVKVSSTISVSGTFDGSLKTYYGIGADSQDEGGDPMFELADGATIKNVILGSDPGDGIHCKGSCTISNVWWTNVGEDAATFKGTSSSAKYTVSGGGAKGADDKVFQHNGAGTLTIKNFQVDDFGKLYRSCGNCSTQYKRAVVLSGITATYPGSALVGINSNYGDTATLSSITIVNDSSKKMAICVRYKGNNTGAEPTKVGTGADGTYCKYSSSDITYK